MCGPMALLTPGPIAGADPRRVRAGTAGRPAEWEQCGAATGRDQTGCEGDPPLQGRAGQDGAAAEKRRPGEGWAGGGLRRSAAWHHVAGQGAPLLGTVWHGTGHRCIAWHGTGHRCMAVRGTKLSTATWSRCQPCAILPSLCPQGIFVQLVKPNSPAALVGLRFGDQILQIDGKNCAGWSSDKAQRALKKASPEKIVMVVRDR